VTEQDFGSRNDGGGFSWKSAVFGVILRIERGGIGRFHDLC
jgi:hypothetical protein